MITMEMLGRIRRMYLRDKLSLHEITKRTGMSRNTVRRWLRTPQEVKVPAYSRVSGYGKLSGFTQVDERLVHQLSTLDFTDTAQNAVLIGGPGTGKTHLATAIGVAGIAAKGKRVRFYSTVDLVNELEREKREGKTGRIALALMRMDLVILDELGYAAGQALGIYLPLFVSKDKEVRKTSH